MYSLVQGELDILNPLFCASYYTPLLSTCMLHVFRREIFHLSSHAGTLANSGV
jgi:hypothetical protein